MYSANLHKDVIDKMPEEMTTGVYYGWAQVQNFPVHKMVMSVGWNPFYKNEEKSMVCGCYYSIIVIIAAAFNMSIIIVLGNTYTP